MKIKRLQNNYLGKACHKALALPSGYPKDLSSCYTRHKMNAEVLVPQVPMEMLFSAVAPRTSHPSAGKFELTPSAVFMC